MVTSYVFLPHMKRKIKDFFVIIKIVPPLHDIGSPVSETTVHRTKIQYRSVR